MQKTLYIGLLLIGFIFQACDSEPVETAPTVAEKWPMEMQQKYIKRCLTMADDLGLDSVRAIKHCDCLLEKMENKYSASKVNKMSDDDIITIGFKMSPGCLK